MENSDYPPFFTIYNRHSLPLIWIPPIRIPPFLKENLEPSCYDLMLHGCSGFTTAQPHSN